MFSSRHALVLPELGRGLHGVALAAQLVRHSDALALLPRRRRRGRSQACSYVATGLLLLLRRRHRSRSLQQRKTVCWRLLDPAEG